MPSPRKHNGISCRHQASAKAGKATRSTDGIDSMRFRSRLYRTALIAILGLSSSHVVAAPDVIQVYTDEINAPGEAGLELHLNHAIQGSRTPGYPGQMPSQHGTQVTPEFSYGLTKNLEAGL